MLACRDQKKATAAAEEVKHRSGNDDVHVVSLDLADLESVHRAAGEILSGWDRIDVLINNAGGIWTDRRITKQGFEQTFGVNHLAHFFLTNLLLERMTASAPSRIVNLTSAGHHSAWRGMRFDDLQSEKRYSAGDAYSRSKLASILFTRGLARRLADAGVSAYAVHPGTVRSRMGMDGDLSGIVGVGTKLIRPVEISTTAGARTSIYVATSPDVAEQTGEYWVRCRRGHMSKKARNDEQLERLWSESEELITSAGFTLA